MDQNKIFNDNTYYGFVPSEQNLDAETTTEQLRDYGFDTYETVGVPQDPTMQNVLSIAQQELGFYNQNYTENQGQTLSSIVATSFIGFSSFVPSFATMTVVDRRRLDCTKDYEVLVEEAAKSKLANTNNVLPSNAVENYLVNNNIDGLVSAIIPINSNSFNTSYVACATYQGKPLIDEIENVPIDPDSEYTIGINTTIKWSEIRDDILRFKEKYVVGPPMLDFYKKNVTRKVKIHYCHKRSEDFGTLIPLPELRTPDKNIKCAIKYASRYYGNLKLAPLFTPDTVSPR